MRLTRRDGIATALVAAVVLIYIDYKAFDGIPFVQDPTGMAAIGLILGFASRRIGGRQGFEHERLAFVAGLGSMALGVIAMATSNEALLAMFVVSIVGLWAAAQFTRVRVGASGGVPLPH